MRAEASKILAGSASRRSPFWQMADVGCVVATEFEIDSNADAEAAVVAEVGIREHQVHQTLVIIAVHVQSRCPCRINRAVHVQSRCLRPHETVDDQHKAVQVVQVMHQQEKIVVPPRDKALQSKACDDWDVYYERLRSSRESVMKNEATRSEGDYRRKVLLARLCAIGGQDVVREGKGVTPPFSPLTSRTTS